MLERVTGIAEIGRTRTTTTTRCSTPTPCKAHELHPLRQGARTPARDEGAPAQGLLRRGRATSVASQDLADLAAELGLDRDDVVALARGRPSTSPTCRPTRPLAQEYGIQGVPFFVIDGKYGVSGAQDAATFAEVLAQVATEKETVA